MRCCNESDDTQCPYLNEGASHGWDGTEYDPYCECGLNNHFYYKNGCSCSEKTKELLKWHVQGDEDLYYESYGPFGYEMDLENLYEDYEKGILKEGVTKEMVDKCREKYEEEKAKYDLDCKEFRKEVKRRDPKGLIKRMLTLDYKIGRRDHEQEI